MASAAWYPSSGQRLAAAPVEAAESLSGGLMTMSALCNAMRVFACIIASTVWPIRPSTE